MESKKNAVVYLRVSTSAQVEGYGLEAQEKACLEFAEKNGYDIIRIYKEEGVSATKTDAKSRPVLFSMLNNEQNPPVSAVIVYAFDRISRNDKIEEFFAIKADFTRKGMKLLSAKEGEDTSSFGTFATVYESIVLYMSALEAEKIKARTMNGRAIKASKGEYSGGKPPYGYRSKRGSGELVINEDEANIVKYIFESRSNGISLQKIADSIKIPPRNGTKWYPSTIKSILNNEIFYRGEYKYSNVNTKYGKHEIILKENHNELQN